MPGRTPALPASPLVLPRAVRGRPHGSESQVSAGRGASPGSLAGLIAIADNTPTSPLRRRERPQHLGAP